MYGMPADFDSGIFVGRTLKIVCVTAYHFSLHFGEITGERRVFAANEARIGTGRNRSSGIPPGPYETVGADRQQCVRDQGRHADSAVFQWSGVHPLWSDSRTRVL